MDIEDITEKYTGQRLGWADLTAAWRGGDPIARMLAHAVERAAYAVGEADADLGRAATSISDALADTRQALAAEAGQPTRCLNPLGELQANGSRFDALVAVRHDRIGHLRTVARLWQQLHATLAPPTPDLTQALTALGFEPITRAHPSTRAAYGHRYGHRHVDVSLDPFGEPGVEVNASDAGTLVWSVTAGPDVPVPVLAALLHAATHPRHDPTPTDAG